MPHMVAQEHLGMVEALRYGTARNQATINAAVTAIGGSPIWLVLTMAGDGVWTVTSNTTINYLRVPMGVTVNVATGVSLTVGLTWADQNSWKTGPGTIIKSASAVPMEITNLATVTYLQQNSIGGTLWTLNGGTGDPAAIRMFINQGSTCGMTMSRNDGVPTATWSMFVNNGGDFLLSRPGAGSPLLYINNNGMYIGANIAPTVFQIQLAADAAGKPGGGSWSNSTSDRRVKTVLGDYTEGMAKLKTLPQLITYEFNGKGGTIKDGKRYVGYIAQDLQPVAPEMVHDAAQVYLEEGDTQPVTLLTTNLTNIMAMLTNAMLEVDGRLAALEGAAGSNLSGRVSGLEAAAHRHGGSGNAGGVQPYTPPAD